MDFSEFWYKTSPIYYFKYGISNFSRKIFAGQKRQKHHINSLVILVIANWHWILNYVCLGSLQNNFLSCSIGIFHVLEFSHFPFPIKFSCIYTFSLSLSLSLLLSLSLRERFSRSSHLMQQERNLIEYMGCATLLLSDWFLDLPIR